MSLMYLLALFNLLALMNADISHADPLQELTASLPRQVMGWAVEGEDRFFNDQTIFEYIDGSGEVYRAYNLRQCLARTYSKAGSPGIVLDVFDMGTSADAFGVFTHDMDGEAIAIGQDAAGAPAGSISGKTAFSCRSPCRRRMPRPLRLPRTGPAGGPPHPREGSRPKLLSHLPLQGLQTDKPASCTTPSS